jgi:hypothetical protein
VSPFRPHVQHSRRSGRSGRPHRRVVASRLLCHFAGIVVIAILVVVPAAAAAQQLDLDVPFDFAVGPIPAESPAGQGVQEPIDASDIPSGPSTFRGAITDSIRLLMIEHSTRVAFQDKTRRELGGPFWQDYRRSVKAPTTWEDGDGWKVNYIGHPIHGAASGFIWLDHEDGAHDPDLGFSREYWSSRGRALAWATAYSVQFEFGPFSEASIGNVGLRENTTGWVDHVVTPVGALGFMVAEDALDRHLIRRIEGWTSNRFLRAVARMALNPSRTLSNTAQGRLPWFRVTRPISGD